MAGYRDPDNEDSFLQPSEDKAVSNVVVTPLGLGACLVVYGVSVGSYILESIGTLVILAVPAMIYIARRRGY